jgi:hypothetical protein
MKTYDEPTVPHMHSQYNKTMATTTIAKIVMELERNPKARFPDTYERRRLEDLKNELRHRGYKAR